VLNFILALLAWPLFAVTLVIEQIQYRALADERRIEKLRTEIEEGAFPTDDMQSVFEFRETFYRYVGLARALNEKKSEEFGNELFDTVEHPDEVLAARCLARKNRALLERHCDRALTELFSTIVDLENSQSERGTLLELATKLAVQIGDAKRGGDFLISSESSAEQRAATTSESTRSRAFRNAA